MMRWVVLALVVFATLWSAVVVIDERETAIITQFGEYKRSLGRPGLYFKTPFMQDVMRMDARIVLNDAVATEYLTLDKKRLVADPITRWRVADPYKFYTKVHDESGASARLQDVVNSELRGELAQRELTPADWGGDTEFVDVSAKTRENLHDLLETLVTLAEIQERFRITKTASSLNGAPAVKEAPGPATSASDTIASFACAAVRGASFESSRSR